MPADRSPPQLVTLILMTALSVLSLNMFLPSLARMATDFGTDYAVVNLSIAGYLAVSAVLQIIMGPLSDRYGRRPVMLAGFAIFTMASLGCALADNVWLFLAFRMAQGAVVAGSVLSRAVIRDMHDERSAAALMGYVAMAMAIAPMMGPLIGGLLEQFIHWRASFVFYALGGLGLLIWGWLDLGETNLQKSETFAAQFRAYPELLRSRRFWGYSICTMFSVGAFYIFLGGAPLAAQSAWSLEPAWLGVGMGCTTAGFFVGNWISGRISQAYPLVTLMIAGRWVTLAGLGAGLVLLLAGLDHPVTFFGAVVAIGIGNGLTLPAGNSGAMSVRPRLAGSASGLSGALQIGGGAVLSTLAGVAVRGENGVVVLMLLLLGCSALSLVAALYVRWVDRREPLPAA